MRSAVGINFPVDVNKLSMENKLAELCARRVIQIEFKSKVFRASSRDT